MKKLRIYNFILMSNKFKTNNYLKHFIIASILFFTSCGEKEDIHSKMGLTFIPQAEEVGSRASFINSINDLEHFIVWGNYDGKEVFTQQKVNKTGYAWEYSPLQYWVFSANEYNFSAYLPEDAGTVHIGNNLLSSIDYDCNEQQIDLMMAYTTIAKENIGHIVHMPFKHALGAVKFVFKLKNIEGYNYTNQYQAIDIRWGHVHTQGTFTLNSNNTITTLITGSLNETNKLSFTGSQITTSTTMTSESLFVIPQELDSASLIFNLKINGENEEVVKTITNIHWESGKIYTYNIIIDPFEITVETTPWEEPTTEDIVIS